MRPTAERVRRSGIAVARVRESIRDVVRVRDALRRAGRAGAETVSPELRAASHDPLWFLHLMNGSSFLAIYLLNLLIPLVMATTPMCGDYGFWPGHYLELWALPYQPYDLELVAEREDLVLVSLDRRGRLFVGGREVTLSELGDAVDEALLSVPSDRRFVIVRASDRLLVKDVTPIVDELAGLGNVTVAVQTDHLSH